MSPKASSKKEAKILKSLNNVQQEAVLWTEGPILILAGAGSGKTRVLTHKIAYLLEINQIKPWKILSMTFTNKAAGEMKERIQQLTQQTSDSLWMGTFHSIFARILRRECEQIGYKPNFSIYDSSDQLQLIKTVMTELNIQPKKVIPKAVRSNISRAKNQMISPEQYANSTETIFEEQVGLIYPIYQQRLRQANAMDFDDLLWKPIELFGSFPNVLEKYQERFQYILVDEYQDTNRAQYLIVKMLSNKHRNISVVGDDDQSIYHWRGADIRNILDFEKDFPECKIFRLEQNYRSTSNILAAAHSVVKNNHGRLDKTLWTASESGEKVSLINSRNAYREASKIISNIQDEFRSHKRNFRDFAILYRTNAQSRILEDELRNNSIPYIIVGGTRFYERKEIKDVMAYLRAIVNPLDTISLKRIINFPARGIGATTVKKIDAYSYQERITFFEALAKVHSIDSIREATKVKAFNFYKFIEKYQALQDKFTVTELARAMVDEIGILTDLRTIGTVEAMSRHENIVELLSAISEFARRHETASLATFLEEVSLIMDIDSWDARGNAITLMTLHAAKGLEFPVIFITGLEEGLFPLSRNSESTEQLEEERRLFYVGATRAQQKLYLSWAMQRSFGVEGSRSFPSRFIDEIDPQYLETDEPQTLQTTNQKRTRRSSGDVYYEYDEAPILAEDLPQITLLEVGMRVRHNLFGEGIVKEVGGYGEKMKVTINFFTVGNKRLMVKYANLEIL